MLRSSEPVAAVAAETGIFQATLFRYKRQALFDAGGVEGIPSVEADKLAAANTSLEQAMVAPKRRHAITEELDRALAPTRSTDGFRH